MLILAFDTTSERGGAGLYEVSETPDGSRDVNRLGGAARDDGRCDYSVWLFEQVERLLAVSGRTLRQVDLFAVANGPGSFTGIRVGVAAAQGWSQSLGRPVRSVSTLEAMVEAAQPTTGWAVPLLDARRGDFFLATYRKAGDAWEEAPAGRPADSAKIEHAQLIHGPNLEGFLSAWWNNAKPASDADEGSGVTLVVREHDQAARSFESSLFAQSGSPASPGSDSASLPRIEWQIVRGSLVDAIARIGWRAFERGHLESPASLDACYVRRSDAEMHWREDH